MITPGSDRRLILFDPKNELHPYILENRSGPGVLPPAELISGAADGTSRGISKAQPASCNSAMRFCPT